MSCRLLNYYFDPLGVQRVWSENKNGIGSMTTTENDIFIGFQHCVILWLTFGGGGWKFGSRGVTDIDCILVHKF